MSLNGLLAALTAEADAEVERTLAEARREAERIRVEAETAVARKRKATLAAREAEARARAEADLAEARRAVRVEVLEARRRMLEEIRAAGRARLRDAARDGTREDAWARLVAEALDYAGHEPGVLRCPPEWLGVARGVAGDAERVRIEADDSLTGVQVAARDDSWIVDNTLDGRLDRLWPELAIEILRRLEVDP